VDAPGSRDGRSGYTPVAVQRPAYHAACRIQAGQPAYSRDHMCLFRCVNFLKGVVIRRLNMGPHHGFNGRAAEGLVSLANPLLSGPGSSRPSTARSKARSGCSFGRSGQGSGPPNRSVSGPQPVSPSQGPLIFSGDKVREPERTSRPRQRTKCPHTPSAPP
jgi:hypothetical protein